MSEEVKEPVKSKGGRPKGFSPLSQPKAKPSIELTIEGDFVVIKLPKKDLSRKLLAELI